jgi:hypothetical protein
MKKNDMSLTELESILKDIKTAEPAAASKKHKQ